MQVERGEGIWLVHVPELERTTQARNLGEVEMVARDLIAIMIDEPPNSFDIVVSV